MGTNQSNDEVLTRRISDKDVEAFREIVDRYQNSVYNICLSLIGDHHQAEEAAQDTFYQIYRSAGTFRGESRFSTWIYRIAVNRSLNLIHKNKKHRWLKSLDSLWNEQIEEKRIPYAPSPDEPGKILEEKERKNLIERAVASLPEKQRVAFVLNKYENLTSKEISEVLGISIHSVEARIHRAKLRLQKKLVKDFKKSSDEP